MPLGNYEALWLIRKATPRDCVYAIGSFAILSLRFFLTSAPVAELLVEIEGLALDVQSWEIWILRNQEMREAEYAAGVAAGS